MKRLLGSVMVLALTSCVAEVGAPEEVGESPEALVATVPTTVVEPGTIPPFEPEPTEPTLDIPGIPRWKAYIGAPKGHPVRYGAASTRPDLVDEAAYIVLVPPPDGGPEQMIPLFLRQAWRYGDLYFERMTSEMGLTPADWIGILLAIGDLEKHPKPLPPTHGLLVGPTFEEGGGWPTTVPPPPPLPGDDHQGPGPVMGGGRTGGGGVPTPPRPPPLGPDTTSPPPLPAVPPDLEHLAQNGVFPGDVPPGWLLQSRPEDASYTPQPGEEKELIRCEGRIFLAYKNNCVDFQAMTPGVKWMAKIGDFFQKKGEAWQAAIYHTVWNDGKNPQCMRTCTTISYVGCIGIGGALWVACYGVTDGLCGAGAAAILAGTGFAGLGPAICAQKVQDHCTDNICIH